MIFGNVFFEMLTADKLYLIISIALLLEYVQGFIPEFPW